MDFVLVRTWPAGQATKMDSRTSPTPYPLADSSQHASEDKPVDAVGEVPEPYRIELGRSAG